MRTAKEASERWQRLNEIHSLSELRKATRNGDPVISDLRSVCWKAFLLFESVEQPKWPAILSDSRSTYESLRAHFLRAINNPDEFDTGVDPLSETDESPWVALRKDEALRAEIFQDVERCMPENLYFREAGTQAMMVDVLFIYCKLNPDIGYRQGMHEVLAPILWAVERDAMEIGTFAVKDSNFQHRYRLMPAVLDPKYIEHDTFTLYGLIMQTAKSFYDPGPAAPQTSPDQASNDTPMLQRSKKIFHEDLFKVDPELYDHLVKLDIVPQIYLMRWVRLLFGREFPFDDVLTVWDMLFAEDPQLDLVDQICVAMLLRIRWELLEADTNAAFALLLRYPAPAEPAKSFVEDALELRQQLTPETTRDIVLKRTGRSVYMQTVPSTRSETPRSRRPQSPGKSPSRSMVQPGSLESMLQSAAKDVYKRSQKLGINKAVRDAVGEVRKNMQGLQESLTSPRSLSDARIPTLGGNLSADDSHSDLFGRITALEQRNRQLAKMLQSSVTELWECQADRADAAKDDTQEKASLEALSSAIAKVQFVQIYLEDSSVPLPIADVAHQEEQGIVDQATDPAPDSTSEPSKPEIPVIPSSSPPKRERPPRKNPDNSTLSPTPATTRTRPSLASSSFSWMLSQDTQPSRTFASTTSPHSAFPERKGHRANASLTGKGFLFGDEDDEGAKPGKEKGKKHVEEPVDEESIDLGAIGGSVR